MQHHDPDEINRLIGAFTDLQEEWEANPDAFDWAKLETLARKGARAYNEGAGPAFHALALDGVQHSAFHEKFLGFSLQAGFDPFKLACPGTGAAAIPVIDHAGLADSAMSNSSSARIRTTLLEIARARFTPLAQEIREGKLQASTDSQAAPDWFHAVEACAESIPPDLLEHLAPELVRAHPGDGRKQSANPIEGYLSTAEMIVDTSSRPYG